jgi:ketosteroid isomerase-like protein
VVAIARYRGTGWASGIPVETTAAHVYALQGGKIVRWRMFNSAAEALQAVGLRE